jgi:hypothetical protein
MGAMVGQCAGGHSVDETFEVESRNGVPYYSVIGFIDKAWERESREAQNPCDHVKTLF